MRFSLSLALLILCFFYLSSQTRSFEFARVNHSDYDQGILRIQASDDSIRLAFVHTGASLKELWVKDREGNWRDVVLGFDDPEQYKKQRSYFGSIVGRYANRIKNGTFLMDGTTYHIPTNENDGKDTLHGGYDGYDTRQWKVTSKSKSQITFSLFDSAGTSGFPATVSVQVTYSLSPSSHLKIEMRARVLPNTTNDGSQKSKTKTPIMLSSHVFFNLDGYKSKSLAIDTHDLKVAGSRIIETDSLLVPTGNILDVGGTPYDFREGQIIGKRIPSQGYDTCWIYDKPTPIQEDQDGKDIKMSLWSKYSGISVNVRTNQNASQMFSCNGLSLMGFEKKRDHGRGVYGNHSCVVLEQQGWIDAINYPSWDQSQFYDETREFHWLSDYEFGLHD